MNLSKTIQESFSLYLKNFGILLLACLIAGIISVVSIGILAGPLFGGVLVLGLKLLRGEKGQVNEIFSHFDQLLPTLITTLLFTAVSFAFWITGIIPVIGWILNLIVSPALGLLYFLAIGFIVDQKMQPLEAVKRGVNCFAAEPIQLWLYSLIMIILGGSGAIILIVGVILTMPLAMAGMTVAYQQLSAKETPLFKPDKQALRIAVISLAVLLVIGVFCLAFGFGGFSSRYQGAGLTSKILSGVTGQKVEINDDGKEIKNFKIGDISVGSGLPDNFPKDIPVYPQAELGGFLGGKDGTVSGSTTTLTSQDSASEICDYYVTNLKARGWTVTTSELGEMKMVNFQKENRSGVITINPGDSKCDILIGITTE